MMTRLLPLVSLLLAALLAGCAASTSPTEVPDPLAVGETEAPAEPAGMTTTLIRVVPRGHEIDWTAYQAVGACEVDSSRPCREPLIQIDDVVIGTTYETPQWAVNDPDALFWRLDAVVEWTTDNPTVSEANLEVFTRKPCGLGCWEERPVAKLTGASPIVFERSDIYLDEGETGLLLRLSGPPGTATPGFALKFETTGHADGYVPAGDEPIVIRSQG